MVTVGMESEYILINEQGEVVNKDSLVLSNQLNNGKIIEEGSHSMIEVITSPADSINALAEDYFDSLSRLESICSENSLYVIPSSTVDSAVSPKLKDYSKSRGYHKRMILGSETREIEHQFPGTHVHVSRNEDPNSMYSQYLLMQAADTIFAAVSSTPYFQGVSNMKDSRVELYRNLMFKHFPEHGQLLPYTDSIEDLYYRQGQAFVDWITFIHINFMEPKDDDFNPYNCTWGPFRYTIHGTFESRSADSTTPQLALGLAAVFMGMSSVIDKENLTVVIDEDSKTSVDDYFVPNNGKIIIPPYDKLKSYEKLGVYEGLESDIIQTYIKNIINFSSDGLSNKDISYLSPLMNEVTNRESFSDRMSKYINSIDNGTFKSNHITTDTASKLRLYTAHEYNKDLSLLQNKLAEKNTLFYDSKSAKTPLLASLASMVNN